MNRLIVCFTHLAQAPTAEGRWRLLSASPVDAAETVGGFTTQAELTSLVATFSDASIEVYLPGEYCPTYWAHLPKKKRDAIASIPFQIEPLLSEPLDQLHFTPLLNLPNTPRQRYPVWVCNKQWLEQWIRFFTELGITPESIAPDYSLLWQNEGYSFIGCLMTSAIGERSLMAGSSNASGRFDFIQRFLTAQHCSVLDGGAKGQLKALSFETLTLDSKHPAGNLLSGTYKHHYQRKPKIANGLLYIAAAIAGLGLLLNLIVGHHQKMELEADMKRLASEADKAFKSALPNTRSVDPLFQLQQVQHQRSIAMKTPELLNVLNLFSGQLGERYQRPLSSLSFSQAEKVVSIIYHGTELPVLKNDEEYKVKLIKQGEGLHRVDVIW